VCVCVCVSSLPSSVPQYVVNSQSICVLHLLINAFHQYLVFHSHENAAVFIFILGHAALKQHLRYIIAKRFLRVGIGTSFC